jgi:hypothetical protein
MCSIAVKISFKVTEAFPLLQPSEVGRRSFSVFVKASQLRPTILRPTITSPTPLTKKKLTEKVLDQRPIRRPRLRVSKRNYRRREFSQAELLHGGGEGVVRVVSARVDLAGELAVGELLGGEQAGGPEGLGGGEGRGVEEVVVAVVGVEAAGRGKEGSVDAA